MKANGTNGTTKNGKAPPPLPERPPLWCGCDAELCELDGGRCTAHGWEPAPAPEKPSRPVPAVRRRIKATQLAERLGCDRRTLWDWYTNGDLPRPHYLGMGPNARRVWWLDEIEEWELARATREPPRGPKPRP